MIYHIISYIIPFNKLSANYKYNYNHNILYIMSKRWNSEDKTDLLKMYAGGKSYDEIGKTLNRSPNAIKLRLESIVYDNLVKGKSPVVLSNMLHTNIDTIKQLYYSHKSFREGRGETVTDVNFDNVSGGSVNFKNQKTIQNNQTYFPEKNNKDNMNNMDNMQDKKHNLIGGKGKNNNMEKIEIENHVMEEIIKNFKMKRQLRKLYMEGKLDGKTSELYDKLIRGDLPI